MRTLCAYVNAPAEDRERASSAASTASAKLRAASSSLSVLRMPLTLEPVRSPIVLPSLQSPLASPPAALAPSLPDLATVLNTLNLSPLTGAPGAASTAHIGQPSPFQPLVSVTGRVALPAPVLVPGRDALGYPVGIVAPTVTARWATTPAQAPVVVDEPPRQGTVSASASLYGPPAGGLLAASSAPHGLDTASGSSLVYVRSLPGATRPAAVRASASVCLASGVTVHSPVGRGSGAASSWVYDTGDSSGQVSSPCLTASALPFLRSHNPWTQTTVALQTLSC